MHTPYNSEHLCSKFHSLRKSEKSEFCNPFQKKKKIFFSMKIHPEDNITNEI